MQNGIAQSAVGNAIEVVDLVKEFRVYERSYATLKAQSMHLMRRLVQRDHRQEYIVRRALDGLTFSVPLGQSVALVGHNGSGKSTMLALLARIYLPTSGEVKIRGRLSSMLELGLGFNAELTGLENVIFSCTMRGLTKAEIMDRYETIREFSELDENTMKLPVRMYSSGMEARLAFAVAIHVDCDILLIDEGIAVGDIRFREKCYARLAEARANRKTIFLVTHSRDFVEHFVDRALWLSAGKLVKDGPAADVMSQYSEHMLQATK
jgi:ABC-type polysaccharide/polyol phosphate transport system ATPase subunit